MKHKILLGALTDVDPVYIEEAAPKKKSKRKAAEKVEESVEEKVVPQEAQEQPEVTEEAIVTIE